MRWRWEWTGGVGEWFREMVWWEAGGREGETLVVYSRRIFGRKRREIWGLALALGEWVWVGLTDR